MFKSSDLKRFKLELEKSLDQVVTGVMEQLDEAEKIIKADSQRWIPYDTGAAYNSYFTRIEQGDDYVKLIVGYDEAGQLPNLPLIHELGPIEGGYGWMAQAPDINYTPEGFKEDNNSPEAGHYPQSKFLEKAMTQNWGRIKQELEVKFK